MSNLIDRMRYWAGLALTPTDLSEDCNRAANALKQARDEQDRHTFLITGQRQDIKRLTDKLSTWRTANDAHWQSLMDIAKGKISTLSAECIRKDEQVNMLLGALSYYADANYDISSDIQAGMAIDAIDQIEEMNAVSQ